MSLTARSCASFTLGQAEKKSTIGKKCLVNPASYTAGKPLATKINVWVKDKKGQSLEKQKAEVLLLDDKVSEKQRQNESSCFSKKLLAGSKDAQYIYFLLDANDPSSSDYLLNFVRPVRTFTLVAGFKVFLAAVG